MKIKKILVIITILILGSLISIIFINKKEEIIQTNAETQNVSNKKIGWGIKREKDHKQPDLGSVNKTIIEKYNGICLGDKEKKNIYITFDLGYEAGYTEKIIDILKENNTTATFFITAHYLNTQEDLVRKMIENGNIVGNHIPNCLMSGRLI